MGYLIVGFLLGVAVSWFWQSQFSGVPAFQNLMQKELAVNGQIGSVTVLKKRLELMEKQIAGMENPHSSKRDDRLENTEIANNQDSSLQAPVNESKGVVKQLRPPVIGINRDQVIALWKEGKTVTEIASTTRLGKGEIELIISMQDRFLQKKAD